MIFAYHWAQNNNIEVKGFDSKIDVRALGIQKDQEKMVIEEEKEIEKEMKLGWKDMNKENNLRLYDTELWRKLIDWKKWNQREKEMLDNIQKLIIKEGTIVIVTGAAHLTFFEKNIKEAIFPFR